MFDTVSIEQLKEMQAMLTYSDQIFDTVSALRKDMEWSVKKSNKRDVSDYMIRLKGPLKSPWLFLFNSYWN